MKPVRVFTVSPALPAPLDGLRTVAFNLRWAWDHDAIELFRRLDSDLWESTGHNPVRMLGTIEQARLTAAAADDTFLSHLERVQKDFAACETGRSCWFRRHYGQFEKLLVGYFSAEFGLTECLSIFAGGLGVLAGDHLKSASDLGVPTVGVGLLYQQGYFRQYLNQAGWQQESYEDNDFHNLPLTLTRKADGTPVTVEVSLPGRRVTAQVWRAQVGRVLLYLLDTNIPANGPADRDITDQLYGGDTDMRIRQEILLGVGGYRALEALGVEANVFHMNEGHSAFLSLEHIRRLMEKHRLSFAEARELACPSLVFTTHTPVEAGHDYFAPELMDRYFGEYARGMGLSRDAFLALGRRDAGDGRESFCMTVLALRLAAFSNGVSRLHGQVSRRMWSALWPGVPDAEVPIAHVTNGVHFRSWISYEMKLLYDRYLGLAWREEPADRRLWQRMEQIPAEELWRTHERRRERLVGLARHLLKQQLQRRGAPPSQVEAADEALDPDALTIGFARRFAAYKRATLLLRDTARLERLLNDPARPVQILIAGKAHPRDDQGKELIRQIIALAERKEFRRRLVFLEDYNMALARSLVQGADVWLNTPRRPLEASGTSGMKAAANGVLNVSTLDGWWDEAWRADGATDHIGWAIGNGEDYRDPAYQDQVEAEALYDLLERDVAPAFYERGPDRLPRRWIERMKSSMGKLCAVYNTHRMVKEYTERFYLIAQRRSELLAQQNAAGARELAAWVERVRAAWPRVRITIHPGGELRDVKVGDTLRVEALVELGGLSSEDVTVELYLGTVTPGGQITDPHTVIMNCAGDEGPGPRVFEANTITCAQSGLQGYTVRVLPFHPDLNRAVTSGLITWAEAEAAQPAGAS